MSLMILGFGYILFDRSQKFIHLDKIKIDLCYEKGTGVTGGPDRLELDRLGEVHRLLPRCYRSMMGRVVFLQELSILHRLGRYLALQH
jgi:hypothetical protein